MKSIVVPVSVGVGARTLNFRVEVEGLSFTIISSDGRRTWNLGCPNPSGWPQPGVELAIAALRGQSELVKGGFRELYVNYKGMAHGGFEISGLVIGRPENSRARRRNARKKGVHIESNLGCFLSQQTNRQKSPGTCKIKSADRELTRSSCTEWSKVLSQAPTTESLCGFLLYIVSHIF